MYSREQIVEAVTPLLDAYCDRVEEAFETWRRTPEGLAAAPTSITPTCDQCGVIMFADERKATGRWYKDGRTCRRCAA